MVSFSSMSANGIDLSNSVYKSHSPFAQDDPAANANTLVVRDDLNSQLQHQTSEPFQLAETDVNQVKINVEQQPKEIQSYSSTTKTKDVDPLRIRIRKYVAQSEKRMFCIMFIVFALVIIITILIHILVVLGTCISILRLFFFLIQSILVFNLNIFIFCQLNAHSRNVQLRTQSA